jgi:hypothetical protein
LPVLHPDVGKEIDKSSRRPAECADPGISGQ